jgi:hypothetical protein
MHEQVGDDVQTLGIVTHQAPPPPPPGPPISRVQIDPPGHGVVGQSLSGPRSQVTSEPASRWQEPDERTGAEAYPSGRLAPPTDTSAPVHEQDGTASEMCVSFATQTPSAPHPSATA